MKARYSKRPMTALLTKKRGRNRAFTKSSPEDIRHFQGVSSFDTLASFDEGDNVVVKKALVLVEGKHIDSQGRPHRFPAHRILRIAQNTNHWFSQGNRIPWLMDHKKSQETTIGDLDSPVEVRRIAQEDITDSRFSHLIGKLGIFADRLVGKGKKVAEDVASGIIKTLSPGLDIAEDVIKEISATPTPAIAGLMTFSRGRNIRAEQSRSAKFAATWEEVEEESLDQDELEGEVYDRVDKWLDIVFSVSSMSDEECKQVYGADIGQMQVNALDGLMDRLAELVGLTEPEMAGDAPGRLIQATKGKDDMALTMAQAAYAMYGGGDTANFARRRGKKKRTLMGSTLSGRLVRAAALGGLAAGGLRYGGAALKGYGQGRRAKMGILESAGRGARMTGRRGMRDLNYAGRQGMRAADAVAGAAYGGTIGALGVGNAGRKGGLSGIRAAQRPARRRG